MGSDRQPLVITGASGYLGGQIAALARRQDRAIVTVGRSSACDFQGDLEDPDFVAGLLRDVAPHTIVHCAARVPKTDAEYRDETMAAANLTMIRNLVTTRPAHVVYCSSMTVYPSGLQMPVSEDKAGPPQAGYAGAKRQGELALLDSPDTAISILRLPGLFGGPRQGGLLYNVARAFATGETPRLPAEPPLWAALHVEDAADICLRAAVQIPQSPRVLNVGYPDGFSIGMAVRALASLFNRTPPACAEGPVFQMNLERLRKDLGLVQSSFAERLQQLAGQVAGTPDPC